MYFTSKRPPVRMPYSRQPLVDRYIQSLALSDVLCSLISIPIFTTEMFVDFVNNPFVCKAVRYFPMYFPITTICNYMLIGIERYVGIFHPFVLPSSAVVKRFVGATWIVAAFLDLTPVLAYNLVRYDLGKNLYTIICRDKHPKGRDILVKKEFATTDWMKIMATKDRGLFDRRPC
ncbi:Pyroglutamylated RFamide peptide receptor [Exaiptasia diaphana]|nr:Pyroglutamylated RFamide peptide receptor [Exaiptasia diaphana]